MKQKQASAGQNPASWNKRGDHPLKSIPSDVLLKARSTLVSIGDALKSRPPPEEQHTPTKTKTKHNTLDYFRKQKTPKTKPTLHTSKSDPSFRNTDDPTQRQRSQSAARKGTMEVESPERTRKSRPLSSGMFDRELTRRYDPYEENFQFLHSRLVLPIQGDGMHSDYSETFDKPRKKLSFREPEIDVYSESSKSATLGRRGKHMGTNSLMRPQNSKFVGNGISSSCENMDDELENQAMRIVRTVGQAFEVCHKLSLNSPTGDDAASATTSDKQEEAISEAAPSTSGEAPTRPRQLDLPPPVEVRASPTRTVADAHPAADATPLPPLEELFLAPPAPPVGLGAQHEARLLREHVEQQAQQTRAAVAQLRLLRDQLAAERAARCEAQARTHQLLVQNKEMLDHISSLVAHLQERECGASSHTPISVQHLTMVPQTPSASIPAFSPDFSDAALSIDSSPVLGNRSVLNNTSFLDNFASFLPQSPIKIPSTPTDNNNSMCFNIPNPHGATGAVNKQSNKPFTFNMNCNDQNLYQKLQTLGGSPNCNSDYKNANGQSYQQFTNNFSNMMLNDGQQPSKPNQGFQFPGNITNSNSVQQMSILTPSPSQSMSSQYTPMTGSKDFLCEDPFGSDDGMHFIRPLSQVDTLTTFDHEGRVRIIVPVTPNGSSTNMTDLSERREAVDNSDLENDNVSMVTLKVTDESGNIIRRGLPNSPPFITRTTSEKVPNRSEMMNNMRLQWTRHTTK